MERCSLVRKLHKSNRRRKKWTDVAKHFEHVELTEGKSSLCNDYKKTPVLLPWIKNSGIVFKREKDVRAL